MADAQLIFDLRLACRKQGCPVCLVTQQAAARHIELTFHESMLDPDARRKLVRSLGFCYEHAWLTDALGQAIIYKDLVKEMLAMLPRPTDKRPIPEPKPCPACESAATTLRLLIESLPTALGDPAFVEEYQKSSGLCLPHLRTILEKVSPREREILLAHQKLRLEGLMGELAEFIRKNDYRFKDEGYGSEADAHLRAAELVVGKRRPLYRKDLN